MGPLRFLGQFLYKWLAGGTEICKNMVMVRTTEHHKKGAGKVADIDIRMLEENLKRSYAERIRRHQIAYDTVQKLKKAKFL